MAPRPEIAPVTSSLIGGQAMRWLPIDTVGAGSGKSSRRATPSLPWQHRTLRGRARQTFDDAFAGASCGNAKKQPRGRLDQARQKHQIRHNLRA
jgi:hypothetical protein